MTEEQISVLVCDDEEDIVEVTRGCLDAKGFKTRGSTSGKETLEVVRNDPPDILILDILMPEMSGIEVIRTMRAEEAGKNVPIVVLSALVDANNVIQCFDEGADDYIIKPPDFDEMAARIRRHVSSSRSRAHSIAPKSIFPKIEKGQLKMVETAIKQIALAAQLAQEKKDKDFQLQCLERIRGFCAYSIKVINEVKGKKPVKEPSNEAKP